MVNRTDYVLISFNLNESSGNALSTEKGHSQTLNFSYETIYIDTPQTDGYKKIVLDETQRKDLEADLVALIHKHNLKGWDGFEEYLQVMDASNGFSLRVTYANNDEIVAKGGFVFPDNYNAVFSDAKEIFLTYCD